MEKYRKCFPDIEQEEKWLNEMSEKGLVLTRVAADFFSSRYYFEQGDSTYTYRVDFECDGDYIKFVRDTCNAEYLFTAGDKLYFRKAKEQGEFEVAFAIAAILMMLTFIINITADLVGRYFKKRRNA